MAEPDVRSMACPREDCADFGEVDKGNVRFYRRYGAGRWSLLRCASCGRSFSERRWTPFFRVQLQPERVLEILRRLSEGGSIRKVAAQTGVDKNTVMKVLVVASRRVRWFQVALVRDFHMDPGLADSVYAFVRDKARERTRRRSSATQLAETGPRR